MAMCGENIGALQKWSILLMFVVRMQERRLGGQQIVLNSVKRKENSGKSNTHFNSSLPFLKFALKFAIRVRSLKRSCASFLNIHFDDRYGCISSFV